MNNSSQHRDCYVTLNDTNINTVSVTVPSDITGTIWNQTSMISGIDYYNGTVAVANRAFSVKNENGVEVVSVPKDAEPTLEVNGDIIFNGESLDERLKRIETMLQIPTRDAIIEEQYPKLKRLYKEYMKELEKCKTWNRLTKGAEK